VAFGRLFVICILQFVISRQAVFFLVAAAGSAVSSVVDFISWQARKNSNSTTTVPAPLILRQKFQGSARGKKILFM
jgi:hypothetical protein